ncbi:hypothetical protein HK19_01070 [Acetobacter persici]|uniref:hypothetical protein n=1 Tax=Acetobacter persici TaxID=1076596 RepID=UPI000A3B7B0B|nr:hypothetical protein [Acetobacter persici]OUI92548.1 hypothetical protein HK19_01070 [Acetobacter persici]
MDNTILSKRIASIFGVQHGALKQASQSLPINYDNLRKMISGHRPVPEWVGARLNEIERLASIAPPPASLHPDADRDEPCAEALEPHLDNLLARATQAGWHPAEVVTAVLGWSVHAAVEGAGTESARALLDSAREIIDLLLNPNDSSMLSFTPETDRKNLRTSPEIEKDTNRLD